MRHHHLISRANPAKNSVTWGQLSRTEKRICTAVRDMLYANGWGISVSQLAKRIEMTIQFHQDMDVHQDAEQIAKFAATVRAEKIRQD